MMAVTVDSRTTAASPALFGAPEALAVPIIQSTFSGIPNTMGRQLTYGQVQELYRAYLSRVSHTVHPSVEDRQTTGLARSILMAPGGPGFALMDCASEGDAPINHGAYKQVFHAVGLHDGGHYVVGECDIASTAAKERMSEADIRTILRREAAFASVFRDVPGVVQMPVAFEQNGRFYFVMKYCERGELCDLVNDLLNQRKTLSLLDRVTLGRKMLQPVAAAHRRNVLHRDLKFENYLLDAQGNPKLSDFGLATYADDMGPLGICKPSGTPEFVSPEGAYGKPATKKTDTWAAGILLYNLLALGLFPTQCVKVKNPRAVLKAIPQWKTFSPEFESSFPRQDEPIKALLGDMLKVDPSERITVEQALERLIAIEEALKLAPSSPAGSCPMDVSREAVCI